VLRNFALPFFLFSVCITLNAQIEEAKPYYENGRDSLEAGNFEAAISLFSKAIEIDPQ
jgi:tetratricopeptide (TPR) repeat protein